MQTPNDESKLSDNNIQCRYDGLSIYNEKKNQFGFSPGGENFLADC